MSQVQNSSSGWPLLPARTPRVRLLDPELQRLAIVAHHWFSQFVGRFGFPDNYTTIDLETSGLSPANNLICAVGHTVVRGRRAVETFETYLDWTHHPGVDQEQFQRDLLSVQSIMEQQGKSFHHTYERLREFGHPPEQVLNYYLELIEALEQRKEVLIAHNGWRFDIEFLKASWQNWLRVVYNFDPELVYDSGIIEKASQLDESREPLPRDGESLEDFSKRIGSIRAKGVKWALDGHCEDRYGLTIKAGVDPREAHRAGVDSQLLHFLMEEHRALAGVADQLTDVKPYPVPVTENARGQAS
jgi:DNA polymerase III epsilon subunit-like protein